MNILKVTPDEAVQVIDECIVSGYRLKASITAEYRQLEKQTRGEVIKNLLPDWRKRTSEWTTETIGKLQSIFISDRYAYEFAETQGGAMYSVGENSDWNAQTNLILARVATLNRFDNFLKQNFEIHFKYIAGNNYETHGQDSPIHTS